MQPRALAAAVLLPLALLCACDSGSPPVKEAKAVNAAGNTARKDPNVVAASEEMLRQLVIKPVAMMDVRQTERIAGRIDFDQRRVARIGANVTGRVTSLHAVPGQAVAAGDLLAQLHSTELGTAQLAYVAARSRAELNARNVERARQLLAADVIGSAELQKRESELSIAMAERRAAADQLRVQGMSAAAVSALDRSGAINSASQVIATAPGVIVEHRVSQGQVVQPADTLFTIADLSRVWAVAEVPEQQIDGIQAGQRVEIEVPALGNRKIEGRLIHVSDVVDAERRTVTVRTELDNADRRLKPAMLATMLIEGLPQQKLAVPSAAVVRENDEDMVLKEQSPGSFRLTKVKLGPEQGGMRTVESGLASGERIVAEGAFHLNNERKRLLLSE
ncbi:efflux RND transporter periplasmic adaptor subunit [Noviherbaspirillum pedocola]|uniref:Efflux RND transporter periplasmic adaptor subunit n=1 Tax=Noviherbaspirillum pedocola TaxID=2801341 RepID=A0A934SZC5_9BURK|nr:efflux RND transporter periplasmic adaptor subunit [Noviherbaspirillum pedocola]MBK4737796.1 efflux RND transporter periplasmic adaptor subunit [Noviherbaspirillum pedocola]